MLSFVCWSRGLFSLIWHQSRLLRFWRFARNMPSRHSDSMGSRAFAQPHNTWNVAGLLLHCRCCRSHLWKKFKSPKECVYFSEIAQVAPSAASYNSRFVCTPHHFWTATRTCAPDAMSTRGVFSKGPAYVPLEVPALEKSKRTGVQQESKKKTRRNDTFLQEVCDFSGYSKMQSLTSDVGICWVSIPPIWGDLLSSGGASTRSRKTNW